MPTTSPLFPLLRPGALVAVVEPAGPADPGAVAAGVAALESWGLRVREATGTGHPRLPWLADGDAARARAFEDSWADPEVDAVWTTRGGYGTQRMIDLVDWERLTGRAPLFAGFSDNTALHQAVHHHLGVASLHSAGVSGLAELTETAREATRAVVLDGRGPVLVGERGDGDHPVSAPVVGGNLTMLASNVGTAAVVPASGSLVLLEDVAEHPFRLDRCLTQLLRSGWLDGVAGVALGAFTDCGPPEHVAALLHDRLDPLGVPVVTGLPFGHEPDNHPVPLGTVATLDPVAATLTCSLTG